MSTSLYVTKEEAAVHFLEGGELVARTAGFRVDRCHGQHAANLEVRVDLVSFDDSFG